MIEIFDDRYVFYTVWVHTRRLLDFSFRWAVYKVGKVFIVSEGIISTQTGKHQIVTK